MEVRIEDCTGNVNTCPITAQMIDRQIFEETVIDIDPDATERALICDRFVIACLQRTCPGADPDLTREILRRKNERDN